MDLADYTGKPCKSKLAYEFLPKKGTKIDLRVAAEEVIGVASIEVETKVLLMVRIMHCTLSLFPSGKILIRGERDEDKAKQITEKLVKTLKKSII
jgi:TATA-box binding protein (TBP) (component of TFIID and TFIIIB)